MISIPGRTAHDGTKVPAVGLGTWPMDDAQAEEAVSRALGMGYRLVDTAANYRNETGTGRGVARSGVPREEIVVTTKLPGRHHGYKETLASFEESRVRLGLSYVDLYLIHWPLPRVDKYVDSWKAMIEPARRAWCGRSASRTSRPNISAGWRRKPEWCPR